MHPSHRPMPAGLRRLWSGAFAVATTVAGLLMLQPPAMADNATREARDCAAVQGSMLQRHGNLGRTAQRLASGAPLTVLAIGSSSTAGVGASAPGAGYPLQLERLVEAALPHADLRMHVSGVGGETAAQTLVRLHQQLAVTRPDLVIWQVGTNDALTDVPEEAFRALVERGAASVLAAGADLVLLDQQLFPAIQKPARYERFVAIVGEVGARMKACVFSRYGLMKAWALRAPEGLRPMLAADGFDMSDRGYACLAGALARDIVEAAGPQTVASPRGGANAPLRVSGGTAAAMPAGLAEAPGL